MSILVRNEHGWILDQHVDSRVEAVKAAPGTESTDTQPCVRSEMEAYRLKADLFQILSPFVMDSQMNKVVTTPSTQAEPTRRKKRKRKAPLNAGEQLALDYHEEVKAHMKLAYSTLLEVARNKGLFLPIHHQAVDNNVAARRASNIDGQADFVSEAAVKDIESISRKIHECDVTDEESVLRGGAVNEIWHHRGDSSKFVTLQSGRYILPPHSAFLMSDIDVLLKNYQAFGKFNLIVLDPPWENKSVKRKKKYHYLDNGQLLELPLGDLACTGYCYLDNYQLLDLPLGGLASPGCLVVVWVTNRWRHIQFVTEELFPRHGINFVTKWFWLKVTCAGEMVCDFDSAHKRPYETLIIGQRECSDGQSPGCQSPDGQSPDGQSPDGQSPGCQSPDSSSKFPADERTIISVPCSLHSKKPPLYEVLQSYLPCEARCLELFARNLQPHWTSWGNEVLLHQHVDFYDKVP